MPNPQVVPLDLVVGAIVNAALIQFVEMHALAMLSALLTIHVQTENVFSMVALVQIVLTVAHLFALAHVTLPLQFLNVHKVILAVLRPTPAYSMPALLILQPAQITAATYPIPQSSLTMSIVSY
jgi:hypothetical protein